MKNTVLLVFATCLMSTSNAQDLSQALKLAQQGQFEAAARIYDQALQVNPDNLEALVGAAYNHSWSGKYEEAARKFEAALAIDGRNRAAMIGNGYNLAWSKRYQSAYQQFVQAERAYPNDLDAQKGLGYVNLWSGNGEAAALSFQRLCNQFPANSEYQIALAQSYLLLHRIHDAQKILERTLAASPNDTAAKELLNKTFVLPAPLELDVVSGFSQVNGLGNFSIRTVQLAASMGAKTRMFLKYDNSLASDLASFVRNNLKAQSFSGGVARFWNNKLATRLELGSRFLPEQTRMLTLSGEQSVMLPKDYTLKTGGFFATSKQVPDEWMAFLGLRIPVTSFYAVEPHFFYSKTFNFQTPDKRLMIVNQFRTSKGYEFGLGGVFGITGIRNELNQNRLAGGFVNILAPFSKWVWATINIRYENGPFDELLTVAGGLKIRFEN
ncbi:MAG: tetratricopeptide repeat protein [Saprospiraceae bacterium]|nr:tetratricopeptide repeat protein [Saprospiraceae bacterium]